MLKTPLEIDSGKVAELTTPPLPLTRVKMSVITPAALSTRNVVKSPSVSPVMGDCMVYH
jgi:hypothetical protein